jgi:hypothetical protein
MTGVARHANNRLPMDRLCRAWPHGAGRRQARLTGVATGEINRLWIDMACQALHLRWVVESRPHAATDATCADTGLGPTYSLPASRRGPMEKMAKSSQVLLPDWNGLLRL